MNIVLDYGLGNIRSLVYKINKCGINIQLSNERKEIQSASRMILPGVGNFAKGIDNIKSLGIINLLKERIADGMEVLGICLGMQLLTNFSEEGECEGLGVIDAEVVKFRNDGNSVFRVPHVGWNNIIMKKNSRLFREIDLDKKFYFSHSYFVKCKNEGDVVANTDYIIKFDSAFSKNNIHGVQFHPEKSHLNGFNIIKNFLANPE